MSSSDSYDPLTWSRVNPVRSPNSEFVPAPGPGPSRWLPLALSAAILLGGAAFAYASRVETAPAVAADR